MFELEYKGENLGTFELSVPGLHNIYNATAAIMTAYVSEINLETIRENITLYKGVGRRFETKGYYKDVLVIDDYAHHPTELKATLVGSEKTKQEQLMVHITTHTYTRTKALLDSFAEAFYSADKVIITDIYAAREDDPGDIHLRI